MSHLKRIVIQESMDGFIYLNMDATTITESGKQMTFYGAGVKFEFNCQKGQF